MEPGTWTHLANSISASNNKWSHVLVLEWRRYTKLLLIMLKTKTIMKQKTEKICEYEWRARAVSFMAPGILYNRPQKYATTKDSVPRIQDPETRILAAGPRREAAEFGSGCRTRPPRAHHLFVGAAPPERHISTSLSTPVVPGCVISQVARSGPGKQPDASSIRCQLR
ncbi:GD23215 [Drosophila simulans]|uniref:GD23215 n=1 Tax=Drosophila simulans TaxID=7240 RepID=B4Q949_DROSI|nr:GD23215 [Drosophila simulans]